MKRYYNVLPKSFHTGPSMDGLDDGCCGGACSRGGRMVHFTFCLSVCTLERLDPFVCFIVLFRSHFLNDR